MGRDNDLPSLRDWSTFSFVRTRTRSLAGILALAALTVSFAEAVTASICASPASMEAMPSMAMSVEREKSGTPEDHGQACAGMDHSDDRRDEGERCPLTPSASQGCSASASAPAPTMSVGLLTPLSVRHVAFDAVARQPLLATLLYRPPRA